MWAKVPNLRNQHNSSTLGRIKVHFEFVLKASSSRTILWTAISTAGGLEGWFADRVTRRDNQLLFSWGKQETRMAEVVAARNYSFFRFRWTDDEGGPGEYVELRMSFSELTGGYVLEVTDFADEDEEEDAASLWQWHIDKLRRSYGV